MSIKLKKYLKLKKNKTSKWVLCFSFFLNEFFFWWFEGQYHKNKYDI